MKNLNSGMVGLFIIKLASQVGKSLSGDSIFLNFGIRDWEFGIELLISG